MTLFKSVCRPLRLSICITLLAPLAAVQAAVHTVSPGQSIQSAVNRAVAGDTVRVLAGTYTQRVVLEKSGAENALITLKGDPGALISGAGLKPVDREGLITVRNASHVRVEGFDVGYFTTAGGATPVGILVEGHGSNVQVVGNRIHDIKNTNTCSKTKNCSEGAHGLAVFGTDTKGYKNILLQKNEVYQNVLAYSEALVINGNVDGFEVLNNDVHDNNNIGYDFIGYEGECEGCGELDRARNGVVRNNRAANNSSAKNPPYKGSLAAGGFYVDGGHHIVFDANVSTGNDIGFEFASEHARTWSDDILMMNNVVYQNKAAGLALGGYDKTVGAARRIHVTNNAFYKNKGWGTEVTFQHKVTDSTFANNIFYGGGTLAENYKVLGTGDSGNVWGANLWWGTSSSQANLPGNRVIADPLFVAPDSGNLHLQSTSPAINAGSIGVPLAWTAPVFAKYYPVGAIPTNGTTDFGGGARIEGPVDLGADEYTDTPPATTIPASPSLLTATAVSSSQINVTWNDNALNETGVRIERSTNGNGQFVEVFVAPSNAISWQDTSLQAASTYLYRVRSTNAAGNSAYTGTVSATTLSTPVGGAPTIVVDGAASDWADIASLSAPGTGGVTALKAYADATYLYLLATGTVGNNYSVFINADNLTKTGIASSYWTPEGSDYVLENGVLYKYTGTGNNWVWSKTNVVQSGIQAVKKTGVLELRIPRTSLVGSARAVRLGVEYSNANWATTGTIPSANVPQAQFTF